MMDPSRRCPCRRRVISPSRWTSTYASRRRARSVGTSRFISPRDQRGAVPRSRPVRVAYEIGEVFEELDVSGGNMRRPKLEEAISRGSKLASRQGSSLRSSTGSPGPSSADLADAGDDQRSLGGAVIVGGDGEVRHVDRHGRARPPHDAVRSRSCELRPDPARTGQSNKSHAVDRGIHISPRVPPGYTRLESDNGVCSEDRDAVGARSKVRLLPHSKQLARRSAEAFQMAAAGEPVRAHRRSA